MTKITSRSLGVSITQRCSVATAFARSMRELEQSDAQLESQLLAVSEPDVCNWIIGNGIMGSLFEYGRASLKIVFHEEPFGDLAQVKHAMAKLGKAWKDVVEIRLDRHPERYRVQVHFKAIM